MLARFPRCFAVTQSIRIPYSLSKYSFILIATIFIQCQRAHEEKAWTFVSMPDFLNVDCDYPEPLWEDALSYILQAVKAEDPEFLLVAGDLVMGHWDAPEWSDVDTIEKYAERYYGAWKKRMSHHDLKYYVAIGDHEVGDNPWRTTKKMQAVNFYKRAFAEHLSMPANGPEGMQGTTFWWRRNQVLFISVDVFEHGNSDQGLIKPGVTGEQLTWLENVLRENADAKHRIVMGHTPILGPVNKWSSSGLMIAEGDTSDLWRIMVEYEVDLYLCGEVHAVTCRSKDGVMQIAHGGLLGYNTRTNYLVVEVYSDRLELILKEIEVMPMGPHKWQTKQNRPLEKITISPIQKQTGFYDIGRVTILKTSNQAYVDRMGFFQEQYQLGEFRGVPIFRRNELNKKSYAPPIIKVQ